MKSQVCVPLVFGASTIALWSGDLSAQSANADDSEIENITVTGTRRAYQGDFDTFETPQAELRIDAETLRNAGSIDLVQALDLSASVARQNNFGGLWNSFAIRGFVGDENLPSNYLVNGFNAGRGFGGARDLSGIESVEVLKGPRAALYGRGEPGGTVNLVTKRPTFETAGEVRLSAGSFSTYRVDADYTTPLSDTVAIRLVGAYEDAESFRDTVETTKLAFSPSLAWRISDASQLVYEMEYSNQETPFDRGVITINDQLGDLPEDRFLGEPSYGPIDTVTCLLGDLPEDRQDFLGEPSYGPIDTEVLGHQVQFQHDFENGPALVASGARWLVLTIAIHHSTGLRQKTASAPRMWMETSGASAATGTTTRHIKCSARS